MGYLILVSEWDQIHSKWARDEQTGALPPFHTIEKTPDGLFYHLAVAESFAAMLEEHGFATRFDQNMRYDVMMPRKTDTMVHGVREARLRASRRYVQQALHGVSLGHRYGLDQYYRLITPDQSMLVPIERAILTRDTLASRHYWAS